MGVWLFLAPTIPLSKKKATRLGEATASEFVRLSIHSRRGGYSGPVPYRCQTGHLKLGFWDFDQAYLIYMNASDYILVRTKQNTYYPPPHKPLEAS